MATVWVPQFVGRKEDLEKRWEQVVFLAARQGLAAKLAREAGLEVRCASGEGFVDLEISGPAPEIGRFLKTLAEIGIGRLVVDVNPEEAAEVKSSAEEAHELLAFNVVDV